MPTKTYIESLLKSINDSDFQNLIIRFLNFKGYNYLSAPGAMATKNKTTIGTPDALFQGLDENKYVLCEITTKEKKYKKGFMDKLKEDIDHCFNSEKTGIPPSKIDTVILAFNSEINLEEYDELKEYISKNYQNENLIVYSIQKLAEELVNFPDIDEFFPNISLFDGISTLDGFIANSEKGIRPDLTNKYLKQEDLFEKIISLLKKEDILLIHGNQGIGKTRLAIELAKEFYIKEKYTTLIINYYDNNLRNNLYKIIQENQKYILIFDNYIQYNSIGYLIDRLQNIFRKSKFKFIFTLREPYLKNLQKQLSEFKINNLELNEVSYEFMKNFINEISKEYKIYFKKIYINKIITLSKGNIGFALMILLPIFEYNDYSYISNPGKAYENYFMNYKSFDGILANYECLKILGILSFFDKIDLNNQDFISNIETIFKINLNECKHNIQKLEKYELINKKENMIEFTDSILSTYIFYYTYILQNILNFEDLIMNFIEKYPNTMNNKIYEVISAFGREDFKNKKFYTLLKIEEKLKNDTLISFYKIFHIYFETQILNFVKDWLDEETNEYFDIEKFKIPNMHNYINHNKTIELLSYLIYSRYDVFALKIFVEIIYKKPSLTKEVFYHLKKNYSFNIYSLQHKYEYQNKLMDFIETPLKDKNKEMIKKTIFIFLVNENKFFNWHHVEFQRITGIEININRFKVLMTEDLLKFRLRVLNYLLELYDEYKKDVEKNLNSYIQLITQDYFDLIIEEEKIIKKIFTKMDFKRYYPNKLAYSYYNKLTSIYYDKFQMYSYTFPDFYEINNIESINKIETLSKITANTEKINSDEKIMQIKKYLEKDQNYIEFFNLLSEIKEYGDWRYNVDYLFTALIEFNEELFIEAFEYYCLNDYEILQTPIFMDNLFKNPNFSVEKIYELINKNHYSELEYLNKIFFEDIPEKEINEFFFYKLISFLKSVKNFNLNTENYIKYENCFIRLKNKLNTNTTNIIQFLTEILINKKENSDYLFSYAFCKENQSYFEDNIDLFKKTYFTNLLLNSNYDYNF